MRKMFQCEAEKTNLSWKENFYEIFWVQNFLSFLIVQIFCLLSSKLFIFIRRWGDFFLFSMGEKNPKNIFVKKFVRIFSFFQRKMFVRFLLIFWITGRAKFLTIVYTEFKRFHFIFEFSKLFLDQFFEQGKKEIQEKLFFMLKKEKKFGSKNFFTENICEWWVGCQNWKICSCFFLLSTELRFFPT